MLSMNGYDRWKTTDPNDDWVTCICNPDECDTGDEDCQICRGDGWVREETMQRHTDEIAHGDYWEG